MTTRPQPVDDRDGDLPAAARRAVDLTVLALAWERAWPRLALLLSIIGSLLALAWLGLLGHLPDVIRLAVVAGLLLCAAAALIRLVLTPWPDRRTAADRLDRVGGLANRPLSGLSDRPVIDDDPIARALWQAHRRRLLEDVARLRPRLPSPRLDRADPYALRFVVLLALTVGLVAAPDHLAPLAAAVRLPVRAVADLRVDVWVSPPAYSGEAPRALLAGAPPTGEATAAGVPAGSQLSVRLGGMAAPEATFDVAGRVTPLDRTGVGAFELRLDQSGRLRLSGEDFGPVDLDITVRADAPPAIRLAEQPAATGRGALRLVYALSDDNRVAAATARLTLPGGDGARPLVALPDLPLALPRRNETTSTTVRDLTRHPLAGARVRLVGEARDDAGQVAETAPLVIDLPKARMRQPLAAAILEQRRLLAEDARRAPAVASSFETLGDLGAPFIDKAAEIIGLRVARTAILAARDDDDLRRVLDYLWQMASAIEAGDLLPTEQRLAAARDALKEALQNGASNEEIARLTEELKAALDAHLQALAEQAGNPGRLDDLGKSGGQSVTGDDLRAAIDRMRELSELGDRQAAADLLSRLDDILSGLRMAEPRPGPQSDPTLDDLADIIRRQQELQNRTHKLTPDGYSGEEFGEEWGDPKTLDGLSREQRALSDRLRDLLDRLPGDGQPGALGDAGKAMQGAGRALGEGDPDTAVGEQGAALDALRRGAREMARGKGEGTAGTDPLGRPTGRRGVDLGTETTVPGEIEVQRARRLLEELRRRFADPGRPQLELDYLRRLIEPF